jgi:hypothetical protein
MTLSRPKREDLFEITSIPEIPPDPPKSVGYYGLSENQPISKVECNDTNSGSEDSHVVTGSQEFPIISISPTI